MYFWDPKMIFWTKYGENGNNFFKSFQDWVLEKVAQKSKMLTEKKKKKISSQIKYFGLKMCLFKTTTTTTKNKPPKKQQQQLKTGIILRKIS